MKKILLDTNAYSHFLRGDEQVLTALGKAQEIFFSIFVLAELYTGFKGGNKEVENKEYLERFLAKPGVEVLAADEETAVVFSEIKHALKQAGTPIPINDVWIAAHTMETGAILISYDQHFRQVPGLRYWDHLPG